MADENSVTPNYKITLTPDRGEPLTNFIICSCIKQPFLKKASYWYLKLNVSSLWAQNLLNDLGSNSRATFMLKIESGRYEGSVENWKTNGIIYNKPCKCVYAKNAKNDYKFETSDMNAEIIMLMVDHILFDMSIKNTFNRKLENMTAFQVFEEYEKSMKSHYSENTFNNNYIGITDDQKSDHLYEQMLITTHNDLHVSDLLLYSKKMMKNLSFHFYDDFYLHKDNKNHITSHFINLSDPEKFTPFDITKYFDTLMQTTILKEIPHSDALKKFTQGYDAFSISTPLMIDNDLVPESINNIFNPKVTDVNINEYDINEKRTSKGLSVSVDFQKSTDRQKCLKIQVPDTLNLAKERLENYSHFINSIAKNLVKIQSVDGFCEWLQFGMAYNLDITRPTEYLYTPIMICNVFYKDGNNSILKHMSKSLMVEYYNSSMEPCEGCKWFLSKACTLHYIRKSEKDSCKDYMSIGS